MSLCPARPTLVPMAEKLHQQGHHHWETRRTGSVQLGLCVGTQFNRWRSRNSVSARASETAVAFSDAFSRV